VQPARDDADFVQVGHRTLRGDAMYQPGAVGTLSGLKDRITDPAAGVARSESPACFAAKADAPGGCGDPVSASTSSPVASQFQQRSHALPRADCRSSWSLPQLPQTGLEGWSVDSGDSSVIWRA